MLHTLKRFMALYSMQSPVLITGKPLTPFFVANTHEKLKEIA